MWRKITPMPPEELQRWERLRRLGRKTYAYKYGVMYWGGCLFLVLSVYLLLDSADFSWRERSFEPSLIVITALVCALGGYFVALFNWEHQEARRRRNFKN